MSCVHLHLLQSDLGKQKNKLKTLNKKQKFLPRRILSMKYMFKREKKQNLKMILRIVIHKNDFEFPNYFR